MYTCTYHDWDKIIYIYVFIIYHWGIYLEITGISRGLTVAIISITATYLLTTGAVWSCYPRVVKHDWLGNL